MDKRPLGEILLEMEIISSEQLEKALAYQAEQNCRFGKALLDLGFATKDDIFKALIQQYGYPYIDLIQLSIPPEVIEMVPSSLARKYRIVPIEFDEEKQSLRIVMSPPFELSLIHILEESLRKKIEFALTTPEQLQHCLVSFYPNIESA